MTRFYKNIDHTKLAAYDSEKSKAVIITLSPITEGVSMYAGLCVSLNKYFENDTMVEISDSELQEIGKPWIDILDNAFYDLDL